MVGTRMIIRAFLGMIVFIVVLAGGQSVEADPDITLIVAAAAAFGTIAVSLRL